MKIAEKIIYQLFFFKTECLKFNTKFPVYQFIDLSSFVYVYLSKKYVHACFKIIIIYLSDMYLMLDLN